MTERAAAGPARLRVGVDARLVSGTSGGVEQVLIGLASGLSSLPAVDAEYLFLVYPGEGEWLRPFLGGACRMIEARGAPQGPRWKRALRPAVHRLREVASATLSGSERLLVRLERSDGTLERAGVDVVHFPMQNPFLTDLPSIYQPHDLLHLHHPSFFTEGVSRAREVRYREFCARARLVVMMSEWGRRDLVERYGLPEHKVRTVEGAPILPCYGERPDADERAAVRARFSLPKAFAFYPAHTWPHKNHLALLEALRIVQDRSGLHVPLVCTGGQTEHLEAIRRRAAELDLQDSVRFLGFVTNRELYSLYHLSRCVVFPTLFEGWGMPLLEAMYAGVPTACSRVTCLPEQAGDAALLFDPADPEHIAHALARAWGDEPLRAELTERGRLRAARFTWQRAAARFHALYREVAAGAPAADAR